jgi:F-box-like
MWQPANRAALPSLEDFKHAKKAISELEDALKDALVALEQAQLRVRALTKDLDERKAWIAPIRKLPNELLSEIFIFGSEMEDLAPVTITEVCHRWYEVVLATPRAWSLIYTTAPEHQKHLVQYVSTFVERSNPCLLHVWISDDIDEESDYSDYSAPKNRILPLFLSSLSRIQCLSIESRQLMTLKEESIIMPNLTRLWLTDLAIFYQSISISTSPVSPVDGVFLGRLPGQVFPTLAASGHRNQSSFDMAGSRKELLHHSKIFKTNWLSPMDETRHYHIPSTRKPII